MTRRVPAPGREGGRGGKGEKERERGGGGGGGGEGIDHLAALPLL